MVTMKHRELLSIPTAELTYEARIGKANFSVVLNTKPTANVTIGLNSSNVAEGTVSTNSLAFTPAELGYSSAIGDSNSVNDSIDGGNDYKVVTAAAVELNPNYL
jgi:hypothetical protein